MHMEHLAERGPMRIDMRHMSEEKIREVEDLLFSRRSVRCRSGSSRGAAWTSARGRSSCGRRSATLCGGHGLTGIRINEQGRELGARPVRGRATSRWRRGRILRGAFAFGQIAAENATEYASTPPLTRRWMEDAQVREVIRERTDAKLAQAAGEVPVEEFEYKVRRLINDYIRPPEERLQAGPGAVAGGPVPAGNCSDRPSGSRTTHDLFKAYEVENIIHCAGMSALASKERTESRWGLWHMPLRLSR